MTAMYPVRVSSSVSTQTDQDLREVAEKIEVPVAHIIRIGIEEKVASLKAGLAEVEARKEAKARGELYVPVAARKVFEDSGLQDVMREHLAEMFRPITEHYTRAVTEMITKNAPSIRSIMQGVSRDH